MDGLDTDIDKAHYLQNLLISRATGGGGDNDDYKQLRLQFTSSPSLKRLLPKWVITNRDLSQYWQFIKYKFESYQERRDFIYAEFAPLLEYLESKSSNPSEKSITEALQEFDPQGIHATWTKALERKDTDAEGAITIARTLLESTCKFILDEREVQYDSEKIELPALYKKAAEELNLAPEQHQDAIFKQILGGCTSVVYGLGALRNKYGDAHGTGKKHKKPSERHAELAINLAGSMALFLVKTHKKNTKKE